MTEVATLNDSALEVLPPQQPASLAARQMLLAHAEMMQTAFELADNLVRTTMVPTRFRGKAQDATAAILYGAEIGLNPIQSLQRVIPIHGMPSIEARTMVALLKARGYRFSTIEQSNTSVTVEGVSPTGERAVSTWTIERAKQAGYVPEPSSPDSLCRPSVEDDWVTVTKTWEGKSRKSVLGNLKYITDPQTMLKAKCNAEVSRDLAPDVLMGISYTSEELQSERWDGTLEVQSPAPRAGVISADEILGGAPHPPAPRARATAKPESERPQDADVVDDAPASDIPAKDFPENVTPKPSEQVSASDPVETVDSPPADHAPGESAPDDERAKLTRKMFALLKKGDCTDKEDRLVVYRSIVGRDDINSTTDLHQIELAKIVSTLDRLDRSGGLENAINDALNLAAWKEAEAAEAAAAATNHAEEN